MSVVGFMAHYAHYLDPPPRSSGDGAALLPIMLHAGYSYGAMITTKLPPLSDILAPFETPAIHSAAADIRLRAQHLAEQQNRLTSGPASPRKSLGMRVGGDEDVLRRSHDVSRMHSLDHEDKIRKGVKELLARTKRMEGRHRHKAQRPVEEAMHEEECMARVENLQHYRSAYLVVSPPVGYMTNLATMSFSNPFGSWQKKAGRQGPGTTTYDGTTDGELEPHELKLVANPSLAIHGDQDGFLMPRKFREWALRLKAPNGSLFREIQVTGAGHFWAEEGTAHQLRDAVGSFGTELIGAKETLQPCGGT